MASPEGFEPSSPKWTPDPKSGAITVLPEGNLVVSEGIEPSLSGSRDQRVTNYTTKQCGKPNRNLTCTLGPHWPRFSDVHPLH
jgi:hypothetical protein